MSRVKHTSEYWSEAELIRAIEKRPILYDKTLPEYRKAALTEKAWDDVAKQINASQDDVKKRWKSLRDTFIKYYRLELTQDSPLNSRKKKWKFYDALSYLRPHCEMFRLEADAPAQVITMKAKRERHNNVEESLDKALSDTEMILSEEGGIQVVVEKQDQDATEYTIYETNEDEEADDNGENNKEIYIDEQYGSGSNSNQHQSKNIEILDTHQYTEDPDERFLLSCLPVLKRLPTRKNAYLKLKIQTLLYEVEFADDEPPTRRAKYD